MRSENARSLFGSLFTPVARGLFPPPRKRGPTCCYVEIGTLRRLAPRDREILGLTEDWETGDGADGWPGPATSGSPDDLKIFLSHVADPELSLVERRGPAWEAWQYLSRKIHQPWNPLSRKAVIRAAEGFRLTWLEGRTARGASPLDGRFMVHGPHDSADACIVALVEREYLAVVSPELHRTVEESDGWEPGFMAHAVDGALRGTVIAESLKGSPALTIFAVGHASSSAGTPGGRRASSLEPASQKTRIELFSEDAAPVV